MDSPTVHGEVLESSLIRRDTSKDVPRTPRGAPTTTPSVSHTGSAPCSLRLLEDIHSNTIVSTDRTPPLCPNVSATVTTLIQHRFVSNESAKKRHHACSPIVRWSTEDSCPVRAYSFRTTPHSLQEISPPSTRIAPLQCGQARALICVPMSSSTLRRVLSCCFISSARHIEGCAPQPTGAQYIRTRSRSLPPHNGQRPPSAPVCM